MTARETWQLAAEKQLAEWQEKVASLRNRARDGASDLAAEAAAERERQVESLEARIAAVRGRLTELRSAGDAAFHDVRSGVECAWGELRHGFEAAAKRFHA